MIRWQAIRLAFRLAMWQVHWLSISKIVRSGCKLSDKLAGCKNRKAGRKEGWRLEGLTGRKAGRMKGWKFRSSEFWKVGRLLK